MRLAETGPESPYPFWIMGDEQTVAETRLYLLAAALGAVTENSTSPQEGVESAQLVMNTNTGEPPRDRQAARQLLLRTLANTMRAEDFLWQPPKDHEDTRLDTEFFILNEEGLVRSSNNMQPVIEHITPFTLTDGWPAAILGGEGGELNAYAFQTELAFDESGTPYLHSKNEHLAYGRIDEWGEFHQIVVKLVQGYAYTAQ